MILATIISLSAVPAAAQDNFQVAPPLPRMSPFKARVAGTALEANIDPATYRVGPGDIFLVSILGLQN
ncbi:MAG: hypothetical protein IID15_07135, partial [Candidatus Marinimicrobia bacterium]|nr:hypothetical protein [Candidatus Neomarinimicrobiota bacterium]